MAIYASRNTSTGLTFEQKAMLDRKDGINISKKNFCSFFEKHFHIEPAKTRKIPNGILSWRFEPDEAYYFPNENRLVIYEKKTQGCNGSVDTKLTSCGWWYAEYKRLCDAVNITEVSYIFILDEWFRDPTEKPLAASNKDRYASTLAFIRATPGCDYFFWGDEELAS